MLRDREGNGAVLSGTGVGKLSTTLQAAGEGWGGMGKVFFTELQSAGVPLRAVPLRCLQPRGWKGGNPRSVPVAGVYGGIAA